MVVASPSPVVVSERTLHCTEAGSDKMYRVQITELPDGTASVHCQSCRVGGSWVDQGYKAQGVAMAAAYKKAEATIKAKVAKGYRLVDSYERTAGDSPVLPPAAAVTVEKRDSGFRPQLLTPIEEEDALELLDDPDFLMQQKHDGRRLTLHCTSTEEVEASNKLGQLVPPGANLILAASVLFPGGQAFELDGENVGEKFHAFDLLSIGSTDLRPRPYQDRLALLSRLLAPYKGTAFDIQPVETWERADLKRAAFEQLKAANAEGVVFKRKKLPFEAGRPNSAGPHRKFKWYATASFVNLGTNAGKRSIKLGLYDAKGAIVDMGSVTISPNFEMPGDSAVVEVRYLYCIPGGKVFQSNYLGERDDVRFDECLMSQLKYKASSGDSDD